MANKNSRLEFFFERRICCHAMQLDLLITTTPRLHVRSAPMSPKKFKQFPKKSARERTLKVQALQASCRKINAGNLQEKEPLGSSLTGF